VAWRMEWHNGVMIGTLKMDKAGRVVLSRALRDKLRLSTGDALEVDCSKERVILRPVLGQKDLQEAGGVWVFDSGEPLDADVVVKTIRRVREERDGRNLGKLQ
jgi:bifunctional DNA-binding transcriptional regulator/antitoxin component of YhaV-PrlF toxin-antitoxin module